MLLLGCHLLNLRICRGASPFDRSHVLISHHNPKRQSSREKTEAWRLHSATMSTLSESC